MIGTILPDDELSVIFFGPDSVYPGGDQKERPVDGVLSGHSRGPN